jgi:HD-GYP domain-containing protein (c-di-GMP phosphodiesterase class II)
MEKKAKKQAINQITSILEKMSDRIVSLSSRVTIVDNRSAQTADKVNEFLERERFIHAKVEDAYSAAQAQTEVNRETTKSLYNLRESTATAFDNVTADVKNILIAVQRLNERLKQEEAQNIELLSAIEVLTTVILEGLLKNQPESIPDHIVGQRFKEEKLDVDQATVSALFDYPEIKGKDEFGEFIYIHPADVAELLQNAAFSDVVNYDGDGSDDFRMFTIGEARYMVSPYILRLPGKNKTV